MNQNFAGLNLTSVTNTPSKPSRFNKGIMILALKGCCKVYIKNTFEAHCILRKHYTKHLVNDTGCVFPVSRVSWPWLNASPIGNSYIFKNNSLSLVTSIHPKRSTAAKISIWGHHKNPFCWRHGIVYIQLAKRYSGSRGTAEGMCGSSVAVERHGIEEATTTGIRCMCQTFAKEKMKGRLNGRVKNEQGIKKPKGKKCVKQQGA